MIQITADLAKRLIEEQFSEYTHLPVISVEQQGHDNRTYRLGDELLIRMLSAEHYAQAVLKEQEILPKLASHLRTAIHKPINVSVSSTDYPYPFSIYKWLNGKRLNLITLNDAEEEQLAIDLARFLKELHGIDIDEPVP